MTGQPNLSREANFSGANGDRENIIFPRSADQEQDWQPYAVDSYSAESTDHTDTYSCVSVVQLM